MKTRVPDYYDAFSCLAGDCPHSCCLGWEVVIDEDTARRYQSAPGPLGDRLRAAMVRDEDGDCCFPLNGGRCPFLNGENLCDIHCVWGAEATSVTCREHPRFIEEYGPFREVTLTASCPAVGRLLLGSDAPLTFLEREDALPPEAGDEWLDWLVPLRDRLLALLQDRSRPLRVRLRDFLLLAQAAQPCIDSEETEALSSLAVPETAVSGEAAPLFPDALRLLAEAEPLEPDWPSLLHQAETAAEVAVPETLLERIAVYFAFHYLLKAVNDGDLLGRAAFCVFAVAVIARLAAVCGLSEALRRFSCEVEHSGDGPESLLDALSPEGPLPPQRLLAVLA